MKGFNSSSPPFLDKLVLYGRTPSLSCAAIRASECFTRRDGVARYSSRVHRSCRSANRPSSPSSYIPHDHAIRTPAAAVLLQLEDLSPSVQRFDRVLFFGLKRNGFPGLFRSPYAGDSHIGPIFFPGSMRGGRFSCGRFQARTLRMSFQSFAPSGRRRWTFGSCMSRF